VISVDLAEINNLINCLYQTESLLELRSTCLKLILPLLRADGAIFYTVDQHSQTLNPSNVVITGLDRYYFKLYREYYKNLDPFRELVYSNIICATQEIFPENRLKTEEYREFIYDFLRPQKLQHELMICVRSRDTFYGKIGVFKRIKRSKFTERDLEVALLIEKHLECIMKNMNLKAMEGEFVEDNYFEFPFMGAIVLDYDFRILRINEVAEKYCHTIASERFVGGASTKDAQLPLAVILDCQELKQKFLEGIAVYPSIPIINNICIGNYHRFISRTYITANRFNDPSFFIILEDCEMNWKMRENSAAHKYKLSSRELQICTAIKDGFTNSEISDRLHIELCTVETHIRNIFMKTAARNRTELVRLLNFE